VADIFCEPHETKKTSLKSHLIIYRVSHNTWDYKNALRRGGHLTTT
jgi:hypothetical protein